MEQEARNNLFDNNEETSFGSERLQSFAAAEMADRGPKAVGTERGDTDAASLRPVNNVNDEEGDEDYDDEDEAMNDDDIEIDEVDADNVDDAALLEEGDLNSDDDMDDVDLDEEDEEDDRTL
jgi:ribonuclease E